MATTFNDDIVANANINMANATTVTHKAGSVTNADIQASAGIDYDKVDHVIQVDTNFGFGSAATPTTTTIPIAIPAAAGTIRWVKAWMLATGSSSSVAFMLHKAGVECLSSAITITNTDADATVKAGTISSSALAADTDYLEAVMTVSSSTGTTGPMMTVGFSYDATPD